MADAESSVIDNRIGALDGLRAIAVLMVVGTHLQLPFFGGGYIGVDIFFVLSGYLITTLLVTALDRGTFSLMGFYWRRLLRLAPALVVVCIAVFVALTATAGIDAAWRAVLPAITYTSDFATELAASPLTPTWSLSIEQQFYLTWPILLVPALRYLDRRAVAVVLLALAVGAAVWRHYLFASGAGVMRAYVWPDAHADPILIGCALALAPAPLRATIGGLWPIALAGLLASCAVLAWNTPTGLDAILPVALLAAAVVASLAANRETVIARLLAARPLRYLGSISYAVYLWHFPVIVALSGLPWAMKVPLALIITTGLAAASRKFIEDPAGRFRLLVPRTSTAH